MPPEPTSFVDSQWSDCSCYYRNWLSISISLHFCNTSSNCPPLPLFIFSLCGPLVPYLSFIWFLWSVESIFLKSSLSILHPPFPIDFHSVLVSKDSLCSTKGSGFLLPSYQIVPVHSIPYSQWFISLSLPNLSIYQGHSRSV